MGTRVTVVAPDLGGTVKAKFRLDGKYLGVTPAIPLTWTLQASPGTHELDVRLYDEDGEQGRQSATFTVGTLAAPAPAPSPVSSQGADPDCASPRAASDG